MNGYRGYPEPSGAVAVASIAICVGFVASSYVPTLPAVALGFVLWITLNNLLR